MADDKKSTYRGFTPAQAKANKKYMQNFVEVKVRMSPQKREAIKNHASLAGESSTTFINRAIDETIRLDTAKTSVKPVSDVDQVFRSSIDDFFHRLMDD
jgi:Zn-dependent oligopeptidase